MPFETAVLSAAPTGFETPLLAIAVPRGELPPSLGAVDQATGGALGRLFAAGDFTGKKDETALVYPPGAAARVLLVGSARATNSRARASPRGLGRGEAGSKPRRAAWRFHLVAEALGSVRRPRRARPLRKGSPRAPGSSTT